MYSLRHRPNLMANQMAQTQYLIGPAPSTTDAYVKLDGARACAIELYLMARQQRKGIEFYPRHPSGNGGTPTPERISSAPQAALSRLCGFSITTARPPLKALALKLGPPGLASLPLSSAKGRSRGRTPTVKKQNERGKLNRYKGLCLRQRSREALGNFRCSAPQPDVAF